MCVCVLCNELSGSPGTASLSIGGPGDTPPKPPARTVVGPPPPVAPARTVSVATPVKAAESEAFSPYIEPAAPPPVRYASPAPVATTAFQPATPPPRAASVEQQPLRRSNPTLTQADGAAAAPPQPSPPQLKHNAVQIEISALRNARAGSVEQAPVRRGNPTIGQSDPRPIAELPRATSPNQAKPAAAAVVSISGCVLALSPRFV